MIIRLLAGQIGRSVACTHNSVEIRPPTRFDLVHGVPDNHEVRFDFPSQLNFSQWSF